MPIAARKVIQVTIVKSSRVHQTRGLQLMHANGRGSDTRIPWMCGKSNLTPSLSSDTRTTDPPFQVLTEGQFAQVERKVCSKGWFRRSVWWSFCRRRPFSRGFPSQGEIFCCRTSTPGKYKSKGSAKVGFKVPGVAQAHQPPCFSARQLFVLKPNSTTAELARSGHFC